MIVLATIYTIEERSPDEEEEEGVSVAGVLLGVSVAGIL